MLFRAFAILGVVVFTLCAAEKLPFLLPTCKYASSDFNSCMKRAIKVAWSILTKGLPAEYDLPPLDPFFYDYQKFILNNGPLHGDAITRNLTIIGLETAHFKGFRLRLKNDTLRMGLNYRIPQIYAEGIYEVNGTMAGFRLIGKGRLNLTLEDVSGTWDLSGIVKNDTLIAKHMSIIPIVRNLMLYVDNPDNSELRKLATMFVNENWPMLLRIFLPVAADYWDMYFCNLLNPFFAKLSFSEMVP